MAREWPEGSLGAALTELEDPRREHLRVHELVSLLLVSIAAMISGMRSLYAIAQWARERLEDQSKLLEELGVPSGRSPSVATLHRMFKRLNIDQFEGILGEWLRQSGAPPKEAIGVDGKTLRGIHGEEIPGVHLVSAYALESGVVVLQRACPGKGEELPTAKALLKEIDLNGRIVMADALLTQREVCRPVVEAGGDYLLPVKPNQPALLSDLEEVFSPLEAGRRSRV